MTDTRRRAHPSNRKTFTQFSGSIIGRLTTKPEGSRRGPRCLTRGAQVVAGIFSLFIFFAFVARTLQSEKSRLSKMSASPTALDKASIRGSPKGHYSKIVIGYCPGDSLEWFARLVGPLLPQPGFDAKVIFKPVDRSQNDFADVALSTDILICERGATAVIAKVRRKSMSCCIW